MDEKNKIKGWYSDFIRGNERWFLLILDSAIQGKKYGTQIIDLGKEINDELNGWVISSKGYWLFRSDGATCFGQTVPL